MVGIAVDDLVQSRDLPGEFSQPLQITSESAQLTTRANLIVERFGVVQAFLGEALGTQMATFQEQVSELT